MVSSCQIIIYKKQFVWLRKYIASVSENINSMNLPILYSPPNVMLSCQEIPGEVRGIVGWTCLQYHVHYSFYQSKLPKCSYRSNSFFYEKGRRHKPTNPLIFPFSEIYPLLLCRIRPFGIRFSGDSQRKVLYLQCCPISKKKYLKLSMYCILLKYLTTPFRLIDLRTTVVTFRAEANEHNRPRNSSVTTGGEYSYDIMFYTSYDE